MRGVPAGVARESALTCLPSAAKLTFSTWSASTASRNVLSDHGELRGSAAETEELSPAKAAAAAPNCARRASDIWGAALRWMTGRTGAPDSASTPSEPTASAAIAERRTMIASVAEEICWAEAK